MLHKSQLNKNRSKDREYYELKYQQQFYVAIFATIVGAFSIFGWNKYDDIEKSVKSEIIKHSDSIVNVSTKTMELKLSEIEKSQTAITLENEMMKKRNEEILRNSEKTNDRFYEIWNKFIDFKGDLIVSKIELKDQIEKLQQSGITLKQAKSDIDAIKKLDFLNQAYLVPNLKFVPENEKDEVHKYTDTVYFKSLKTLSNIGLPEFTHAPSIIISPYTGIVITIRKVTKDYYIIKSDAGGIQWDDELDDGIKYDLLIVYKETK